MAARPAAGTLVCAAVCPRAGRAPVEPPQELQQAEPRKALGKKRRGGLLDVVRLVEDHAAKRRKNGRVIEAGCREAEGEIREQEVVVGHQDLRRGRLPARFQDKASLPMCASQSQAGVRLRAYAGPAFLLRIEGEVRPASRFRGARPLLDCQNLRVPLLEEAHLIKGLVQPMKAQVVPAPLHEDHLGVFSEDALDERDVLVQELLLEIDGVR